MGCNQMPELMMCDDWAKFDEYDELLYQIFKRDFIDSRPLYEHKEVGIRKHPMVNDKEQTFFHITSKDYNKNDERCPDPRRCERIGWIRKFIENDFCVDSCNLCNGLKIWEEAYKTNQRIYLLFEEERYVVIIERRKTYFLLITAYYLDYNHSLNKLIKRYNTYEKQKALRQGETQLGTPSTTGR